MNNMSPAPSIGAAGIEMEIDDLNHKPEFRRRLRDLMPMLEDRGLARDTTLIYQIRFMLADPMTADQIECLYQIIEILTAASPPAKVTPVSPLKVSAAR